MAISGYVAALRARVGHDMLMLPSVSAVVRNDAGEVLLGRRSDNGAWALIAGIIDPGEQPADAIVREIFEETGVRVRVDRLAGVALHPHTYPNGDVCQYLNVWFHCTAVGGTARPNDEENAEVRWFPLDGLPDIDAWARLRIDTTLSGEAAWFARPGQRHHELE
jgi:8-oxo-dGTP diphosphatase